MHQVRWSRHRARLVREVVLGQESGIFRTETLDHRRAGGQFLTPHNVCRGLAQAGAPPRFSRRCGPGTRQRLQAARVADGSDRRQEIQRQGLALFVSGCEYARDLTAPPAALQGGAVFLRRDALRRWLWDKIEIWGVRKADGALKAALECYGFAADAEQGLESMSEQEAETLILHELGEAMAEPLLGPAWRELIASFTGRRAEILARAVRDNLADCLSTLPRLVERNAACSIHFYFASFEGVRSKLFPLLAQAYRDWRDCGSLVPLRDAARAGSVHWHEAAQRLLRVHQGDPAAAEQTIAAWIEDPAELVL